MRQKNRGGYKNSSLKNVILWILVVLSSVLFLALFIADKIDEKEKAKEVQSVVDKYYEELKEEKESLEAKEATDSFYQKLSDGFPVNILIVGDSIGEGAGASKSGEAWFNQLQAYLKMNYKKNVSITNVSMGGNSSYAGYVRTMALDDKDKYDLAIICYGQNDGSKGFSTYYESIIRAVRNRYPECSIISVLESSQREYTEKMIAIQDICNHYGIPIVDTIAAFNNSEIAYDELSKDGVHPSDKGQNIYFEETKKVIDSKVLEYAGKMEDVAVINDDVHNFDNFVWYSAKENFERADGNTFVLNTNASGILGIDYMFESGDNKADIYIDGELYKSPTVTFDYDFSQRHIMVVDENVTVEKEIKVVFNTKEQADGFNGMCFSWK